MCVLGYLEHLKLALFCLSMGNASLANGVRPIFTPWERRDFDSVFN